MLVLGRCRWEAGRPSYASGVDRKRRTLRSYLGTSSTRLPLNRRSTWLTITLHAHTETGCGALFLVRPGDGAARATQDKRRQIIASRRVCVGRRPLAWRVPLTVNSPWVVWSMQDPVAFAAFIACCLPMSAAWDGDSEPCATLGPSSLSSSFGRQQHGQLRPTPGPPLSWRPCSIRHIVVPCRQNSNILPNHGAANPPRPALSRGRVIRPTRVSSPQPCTGRCSFQQTLSIPKHSVSSHHSLDPRDKIQREKECTKEEEASVRQRREDWVGTRFIQTRQPDMEGGVGVSLASRNQGVPGSAVPQPAVAPGTPDVGIPPERLAT